MSNKIALATIQFRADAKGANVALDSLRMNADNARRTMKEMQDALDKGIKTMKDSSGVEFSVAGRLKDATREAKNFEAAIRELMKGATALEEVVKNISMGEIEKSSRAELKGAINAAESRKRSVRGDDEDSLKMQRELNIVIEESRKQLNNLDRDTQKVIDTLKNGGVVAESVLSKEQKGLQEILAMIPKGTEEYKQYAAQLKEIQNYVSNIRQMEQVKATSLLSDLNLGKYSEEQIRSAIDAGRQLIQTYKTASPEAKTLADNIARAEQHLKETGIEAARVAAREASQIKTQEEAEKQLRITMNKRLRDLKNLSADALAETKRYWQEQVNATDQSDAALARYQTKLKSVINQERERKVTQFDTVLRTPDQFGVAEVRNAVGEMEKLRDSVRQGSGVWLHYNKMVEQGKAYLDELAKSDAMNKINTQMQSLNTLSTSGLQEVKRYWETMVAGAERGSQELDEYKAKLKAVEEEEQVRTRIDSRKASSILTNGSDLGRYSENEIRAAIEAGSRLVKTYQTASPEAESLAMHIVRAEEYLKRYGVEAERTAAREARAIEDANKKRQETTDLMIRQWNETRGSMSDSALKAHERYWQQLIDDPKTASESLEEYRKNLEIVQNYIKQRADENVKDNGIDALRFFRGDTSNASANDLKQNADALRKFRDSLPREDNAEVITEINGYLLKTGQIANSSTDDIMALGQALELAGKAGTDGFAATEAEIKSAMAAIEKDKAETQKSIEEWTKAGRMDMVKAYEEDIKEYDGYLRNLKIEMDNVGMSHKRMSDILESPIKADNLNELRQAIKRAKQELNNMDGSLDKNKKAYEEMAAQVKKAEFQLKQMEGQAKGTASAFEKAWSRLKTYITLYVGAAAAMQKITGTMGDLMELSDKMGEVRKTTNLTEEAVGELSRNLAKLDVRTPLTDLMSISAAAGQLGLKTTEDIQGFTEAANKLMIALPEMGKEAATEMMRVAIATGEVDKIRKQLQEGTIEGSSATAVAMEKIASTIDRLRASSASTAPEITDFVKRLGAVGAQSGISIDQIAALGSTISSLGMRVEMSATALSRMVPAIRNNAFAIANAIGVAPEALRSLFEAGRGMEAILMIFQHLKEQNANADTIESLLGIGNMKDVMKQLNQQGARAGIVFAGLSQNVDELRKQLVIANEAYEENTAIQREFDRMNDTTAAKWERLKNRLEEMVVGDTMQKFLGGIIKLLDDLVKLISDTGPLATGAKTLVVTFTALKLGIGEGLKAMALWFWNLSTNMTKAAASLKAFGAANWIGALVTAVTYLAFRFYEWSKSINVAASEMAKLDAEIMEQTGKVNVFFRSLAKTNEELSRAKTRLEEVTKADKDTTEAEDALKKVSAEHAATIRDINSKYGTYLGYMLSETSSAEQLARARELINAKLRETITLKQQEAALGSVEQEFGGKVNKRATSMESTVNSLFGNNYEAAARVSVAISEAAQNYAKDSKQFEKVVMKIFADNFKYVDKKSQIAKQYGESVMQDRLTSNVVDIAEDYREAIEEYTKQEDAVNRRFQARININRKKTREATARDLNAILADWKDLVEQYRKAEGDEKEKLAVEVYKQQRAYANAVANNAEYFDGDKRKEVYDKNINNMKTYEKGLRSVADEAIRTIDAMERAEGKIAGLDLSNDGESNKNPWGGGHDAASTDWKNMTANQLVERRKQMKEFVNAIQTDTDVQSVLKEDAALKKAIENGMSSDMRTVIEWYNTERLKIQDELHARHLTNTGDWMDPKKQRGAHKQFRDEMDAYLHELDAYYTERKTRIEEAGTDEGLTEAEIKNRTLNNEMEWQQRRAELQKLYSRKQKEVTEEELNAIYHIIAERTGDSEKFVKAQIAKTNQFVDSIEKSGEKGAAIVHRWMSQVELDTERSYLKGQQALTKQMRAIEAIIDKERPFNGITKSLQESLSTMDILTGEMHKEYNELMKQGKDMTDFNNRQAQEEMKRTAFLLGEAENAYSTTIDHVMDDMRQKGMTAWADWLSADPKLQEALMAQLRSTYDAIQDAIKKEASQLKKQAEIMWNNILMPDGKTTLKQQTDRIVAQLGLDEGRVSRANSLIGAGAASERVADRLAIKQMQMQLAMQEHYYNLMKKQGQAHVDMLNAQAKAAKERGDEEEATRKTLDAQHAQMSLNLATSKEETELAKQREEIIARTEESQNRLYTSLREWADLLASSLQGVFEASHAGDAEYYNEFAKMRLTGKGGPGAGTYIVIDNEGTEDATAHYEYLNERQALERQHEIEIQNAQAEAWKKLWDDINMKMSDQITDWLNASLQNQSIDTNTQELDSNTQAVIANTEALYATIGGGSGAAGASNGNTGEGVGSNGIPTVSNDVAETTKANIEEIHQANADATINAAQQVSDAMTEMPNKAPDLTGLTDEKTEMILTNSETLWGTYSELATGSMQQVSDAMDEMPNKIPNLANLTEEEVDAQLDLLYQQNQGVIDVNDETYQKLTDMKQKYQQSSVQNDKVELKSSQSKFAKMAAACNMYGLAYQTVTNDNLNAAQKFQLFALQAAGQTAIGMLTTDLFLQQGKAKVELPGILGKAASQLGPIAGPIAFAAMTALLGGLMGMAVSQVAKSKSQISQVTGASIGAGRLSTGMLTYAEGNVNEFSDPASLTPGRSYNVDAADGKTYRAKYTGTNPNTHLTNGPEFHLSGEKGREMIIDAGTTRQITMNDNEIWHAIKTLSGGGRLTASSRRGRGVRAFAEGNVDDFEMTDGGDMMSDSAFSPEMMQGFQQSLDRNSAVMEQIAAKGIKAIVSPYGPDGIVAGYDKAKKEAQRHGERYL